jgi:hypothetical protein
MFGIDPAQQPKYAPQVEAAGDARERFNTSRHPSAAPEGTLEGASRPATPLQTQVSIQSMDTPDVT